jgi:hypothetical protein
MSFECPANFDTKPSISKLRERIRILTPIEEGILLNETQSLFELVVNENDGLTNKNVRLNFLI